MTPKPLLHPAVKEPTIPGMSRSTHALLLSIVLLITAIISIVHAASPSALETHEIFVAQTAREMIEHDQHLVPMFGEVPRLKKPPVMYWAVDAVACIAGRPDVPEWVARLPSALATIVLVAIAGAIGTVVYERSTGVLAAAMAGLSLGSFEYGASARPEMLYSATTALTVLCFVLAWSRRRMINAPRARFASGDWWALAGWASFGLATMVKGPQLPLLVLIGMSVWAVRAEGIRAWSRAFHPILGFCIAVAIVAPWFIAVMLRVDGAAQIWMNELIGQRFGEKDGTDARFSEWLMAVLTPDYLVHCVTLLLPWGVLMPFAFLVPWSRARPGNERGRMIFVGMAVAVLGLSLVRHSRDYYILPLVPIFATLLARATLGMWERARIMLPARRLVVGIMSVLALAGIGLMVYALTSDGMQARDLFTVALCIGALAGGSLLFLRMDRRDRAYGPIAAALACWGCALGALATTAPEPDSRFETLDDVATAAASIDTDHMRVVAIKFDPSNLMYRLDRPPIPLQPDASLEEILEFAPVVLVAPPEWAERLRAIPGVNVTLSETIEVDSDRLIEVSVVSREQQ